MKFPLVWRSTYNKLMTTKLALEGSNNALRLMLREKDSVIDTLTADLHKAQRNDKRDPKTGRFVDPDV